MENVTIDELKGKKCQPCEGGVEPLTPEQAERFLDNLPGWKLGEDGRRIRREWVAKDFLSAVRFFQSVAELAEEEGHHPDLHLIGYRKAAIELTTHAIDGLSENDFILAAKIGDLPVEIKADE